nr:hypothetical protein [Chondromyces apiculatus]
MHRVKKRRGQPTRGDGHHGHALLTTSPGELPEIHLGAPGRRTPRGDSRLHLGKLGPRGGVTGDERQVSTAVERLGGCIGPDGGGPRTYGCLDETPDPSIHRLANGAGQRSSRERDGLRLRPLLRCSPLRRRLTTCLARVRGVVQVYRVNPTPRSAREATLHGLGQAVRVRMHVSAATETTVAGVHGHDAIGPQDQAHEGRGITGTFECDTLATSHARTRTTVSP